MAPTINWQFVLLTVVLLFVSCHAKHELNRVKKDGVPYFYEYHPLETINPEQIVSNIDPQIKILVSKTVLTKSAEPVKVTWFNPSPSTEDWIALYSPIPTNFADQLPVKYIWATWSPNYIVSGVGSYSFNVVNLRDDYIVVFFQNGTINPILSSIGPKLTFVNYNEPLQEHLALSHLPNALTLTWSSKTHINPQVKYGVKSGKYDFHSIPKTITYEREDLCGGLATGAGWRDPGEIHTALLNNLEYNTTYYYIFGDESFGFSSERSFVSPLPPASSFIEGEEDLTTNVVVYGDLGQAPADRSDDSSYMQRPALNTTRLVLERIDDLDLVLHIGDIGYALGISSLWDEFFHMVAPIASKVPYMTAVGNHEADWPNTASMWPVHDSEG